MVKEDYLNSDDIEVATLYANIIYQEKGVAYFYEVLRKNKKCFLTSIFYKTGEINLHKGPIKIKLRKII